MTVVLVIATCKPTPHRDQVFADTQGNGLYLFERDCSVQRRRRCWKKRRRPGMTRRAAAKWARRPLLRRGRWLCPAPGRSGSLPSDGRFNFMEMNTRLQVEHPVTQMISQDLGWQCARRPASPLPFVRTVKIGHALESVLARDANRVSLPSTVRLVHLSPPAEASPHVRAWTGV